MASETTCPLVRFRLRVVAAMREEALDLSHASEGASYAAMNRQSPDQAAACWRSVGEAEARSRALFDLAEEWEASGLPAGYQAVLRSLRSGAEFVGQEARRD